MRALPRISSWRERKEITQRDPKERTERENGIFDPAPEEQSPNIATMALALEEVRAEMKTAIEKLQIQLEIKWVWWEAR